jgi:hypothetical protein
MLQITKTYKEAGNFSFDLSYGEDGKERFAEATNLLSIDFILRYSITLVALKRLS